ncbi:OLC1v1001281C1 [Oldenlandia corymbosa var. corymbosa]|uniref:OLC1v1001281C1 n=1 Tax=Oldenlandia corymbosa var. corymbosa TaxID=529605 RepID=A0AAV1D570_OLDCO|nr:OLC1v1001281C1 [Oldenlandia corymbosa var. corymbosa]
MNDPKSLKTSGGIRGGTWVKKVNNLEGTSEDWKVVGKNNQRKVTNQPQRQTREGIQTLYPMVIGRKSDEVARKQVIWNTMFSHENSLGNETLWETEESGEFYAYS